MPPGKAQQSNAMLYTMITFVALFIIATTCAVIFYVKAEDFKTAQKAMEDRLKIIADPGQQANLSKIVGKTESGQTALGAMAEHVNFLVSVITGEAKDTLEQRGAAEKVNNANMQINKALKAMGQDVTVTGGQMGSVALLKQIENLLAEVDKARGIARMAEDELRANEQLLDQKDQDWRQAEQQLNQAKTQAEQKAIDVQAKYDELEALMERSREEQVQNVMDRLEEARTQISEKNAQLQAMQAQLDDTEKQLQEALGKLNEWLKYNKEVAALKPDAKIVRIDDKMGVVYLNIGSDDHVYVGLTFGVYDRNAPLPEDGKGKAEIEVFDVSNKVSIARINRSMKNNPIVPEDVVANLVWDSQTSNQFMVIGDFDFNRDGTVEKDGILRVKELIERWGGQLVDEVTINTNFLIVGQTPVPMAEPTPEEMDANPSLARQYQESLDRSKNYQEIMARAERLSVPVLNQSRFMHLIGYESLAAKSTPF
ncbi:MAG: hypothetical protein JW828_10175 [Sedimentisphaerales bacterium]|nr:hypothetical protein [Sedimentisphaerales bacterium]